MTYANRAVAVLLAACITLGALGGDGDFDGAWATNFGPMHLVQDGDLVTGTYGFGDERAMKGRMENGRLELRYGARSDRAWFELDETKTLLDGGFETTRGESGYWGAYRIAPSMPAPVPGAFVTGQSKAWLNFHLRMPDDHEPGRTWPAIAFLHGSNMTSRDYVETIVAAWPDLARSFILVGIDGERIVEGSTAERPAYNFTYINFSGPGVGPAWVHRQSPALVADTLVELKAALPIERWLLGGHSQGGFLTYAVAMYYPESIAGAFPMSCNLLVQCEPDVFDDDAVRRAQRGVAFAPIHGRNDGIVAFSGGEYCYRALQDGGFPALRFFTHKTAGHMFAHLPVLHAVQWLDAMTAGDAARLTTLAEGLAEVRLFRAACAASARARDAGADEDTARRLSAIDTSIDEIAAPQAEVLLAAIRANETNAWVDDFWTFRRDFALTRAARPVLDAYAELRAEHAEPAQTLFYEARNERDDAKRRAKHRALVEQYYASKWWPLVKGWLDE